MAKKRGLEMLKKAQKQGQQKNGQYLIGVYPGTFDPVTNGHLDIIGRAAKVVDKLVVAVAVNVGKGPLFSLKERAEMCRREVETLAIVAHVSIEIQPFNTLLIDFVVSMSASVIIRGLRAVSDFEYEFQMAGMNARLNSKVETMFLMASERNQFISSRFVKEIASLGGDISSFVPANVCHRVQKKYQKK